MKFNTTLATAALMMAIALMTIAYGPVGAQDLQRQFIDPAGGFTQVVTVSDHGVKTIYVSGQVGRGDGSGEDPDLREGLRPSGLSDHSRGTTPDV